MDHWVNHVKSSSFLHDYLNSHSLKELLKVDGIIL